MAGKHFWPALLGAALVFSGCGSGAGTNAPRAIPQAPNGPLSSAVIDATTTPLEVHIGFNHGETTSLRFGPVWYYSKLVTGDAQVIRVEHGSQIVFVNDDPSGSPHTASGLGAVKFPASFDNTSGFTRNGTRINGTLTWSTGTLSHGAKSQVFTVGVPGHYFFGCNYHYSTKPTSINGSMGDVIVSV